MLPAARHKPMNSSHVVTVLLVLLATASVVSGSKGFSRRAASHRRPPPLKQHDAGRHDKTRSPGGQRGSCEPCPDFAPGQGPTTSTRPVLPEKGVFEELDADELTAVRDFLLARPELNLTPNDVATGGSSLIFYVELKPPPKAEAIRYLDGLGPKPERRALAVLNLLNDTDPRVMQVEVGNLPTPSFYAEYAPRKFKHPIHIHDRAGTSPEYIRIDELMLEVSATLDEFMKDQLGGFHYPAGCDPTMDKCLWWTDSAPKGVVDYAPRGSWMYFVRWLDGFFLHPVGLDFYVITAGTDPSKWHITKIWYANRLWDSAEQLLDAWRSNGGDFGCCTVYNPTPEEATYSTFDVDTTNPRPKDGRPGSQLFEPYGKRFTIEGNVISYMGWQAAVGIRTSGGLRLFDVRFKGERLVYELSLQQAASVYGGASPFQATTMYLDSSFGMGASHFELVHGVDCPLTAAYMDMYHMFDSQTPLRMKNSVCVFELDPGLPLRRHYDQDYTGGYSFYGGVRSHALVVRAASTVYNYDYFYDILFYLDGTIETKQIAFGYPQTERYNDNKNLEYGYPMWWGVGGTVHAHSWHWKVDLDVVGPKNSFLITDIKAAKQDTSAWNRDSPWTYKFVTEKRVAKCEEDAVIKIDPNHPKCFAIVNKDERNKWGSPRGYRIEPVGIINQVFGADWSMMPGLSWTQHHVVATHRREDEQVSCTVFEQATPATPVLDFSSYTDGDNLEQEDLVVWLTVGGWHIPLSEDAPNTPSTASHGGFVLRPYNYFDKDAAKDLIETKLFRPDPETRQPVVVDYGMLSETDIQCIPSYPNITYDGFTDSSTAKGVKTS